MSLSDLKKMQLLRPEEEWSGSPQRSDVQPLLAMITAAIGILGCILMIVGDGRSLTWIGLLLFSVALGTFTWVNLRGVWKS
ncbi:MAG: hypothetical protein MK116_10665 [Phycisphaerales bacterium]|nr:hypothetical protein [Phycisphaerales bacterium]